MKIISELLPVESLGFGQYFGPLKASAHYTKGTWSATEYTNDLYMRIGTTAKVLHYAQEIFEGLKAFRHVDGKIAFFRPHANLHRLNFSANIMAMPDFPEAEFLAIIKRMANELKHLVPERPGALYLRPAMIGVSDSLGVASADEFEFFVVASPVGGYFKDISADKPVSVKVKVSEKHVRAAAGGTGAAKTGGNYAASLRAIMEAKNEGFSNVLFLDAKERSYVEELGGMNFFVVDEGVLKTPPLGDTILAGITRDSILRLAKSLDIACREEAISIFDLVDKTRKGKVSEAFACGTAACISSISHIGWRGENIALTSGPHCGPVATHLFKTLTDIQWGKISPPESDWIYPI